MIIFVIHFLITYTITSRSSERIMAGAPALESGSPSGKLSNMSQVSCPCLLSGNTSTCLTELGPFNKVMLCEVHNMLVSA